MSSPSTPQSARSASRTADSPAMLTPGQKIKAMMAQFDSDSDSDNNTTNSKPQTTKSSIFNRPQFATRSDQENDDEDDDEDEDDDIIMPKGRMAARMQAENQNTEADASTESVSAMERVSKSLRKEKEREDDAAGSSDDDLPTAGPRRRLANAKINEDQMDEDEARTPERERSFSPLFVSPGSERNGRQGDDGSEASENERPQPKRNARFEALIAQKRAEREEKEKQERQKKKERAEAAKLAAADEEDEDDDMEMDLTGKSSRAARPSRKASRKALEDMNRETQRMSRNLQLAHQATTSKKISKESFFARFNFMQPEQPKAPSADNSSSMAGSQNSSDAEAQKNRETPQTSPVVGPSDKLVAQDASTDAVREETQFPSLEKMVGQAQQQPEQPVVGRVEEHTTNTAPQTVDVKGKKKLMAAPSVHVRLSRQAVAQNQMDDSDSDLEVVTSPAKSRRLAAFENVPSRKMQESSALLKLKALAHLTSPTRKTTMNNAELSATLIYQAKKQAAKERQEKVEELRAKGVIIETAAERAAMEDELENLVEKARKEAEDIAKQERSASKTGNGDMDDDEEEDEEDEDYDGSEDEVDDNGEEDEEEHEDGEKGPNLFDSEAGEEEDSEDEQSEIMSTGEPETITQRRKRPTRVIEDDDEEEEQAPTTPTKPINATPLSIERPQIPGLPSNDMTMSLTQAFAGTLGGSQQDSQPPSPTIPHSLPDPAQRGGEWQQSDSQMIVKDSQEPQAETTDFLTRYTPSDARVSESPAPRAMSQFSSIPDPTQDEGFVLSPFDPSKRFMGTPTSTVETVLVDRNQSLSNSPVPIRKMKNLRRGRTELSAIEEQEESGFEVDASAFNVMKKAAKKPNVAFDRKKSKAKDVVEEAAEESEDEYAGLGGASDEEDEEENAYDRQMINDNSGETVDEKQLAALNAQHQRTTDEKQVAKLMRDITTGALRRRKGPDDEFDLDDSDDELLARRRQKQREFARMRNALMADGKVGELAENPKKAAFFRAIEDHDSDDDVLDFLDEEEAPGSQDHSSSQEASAGAQQDTTDAGNKRKRPLEPSTEETYNRPPPNLRRKPASAMSKKPASLAEIRETLSFLTERPEYDSFQEDASMEDEQAHEEEAESAPTEEQSPEEFAPRVHPRRTKGAVVDRLALLRQASSNSATSASTRVAFHAGSGAQGPSIGFRPPPMLRKATTGSSSSGSSKSDSRRMSAPGAGGGSMAKKGAVNYYTAARERERERELRTQSRAGGSNITKLLNKHSGNRLGALGGTGQWD
ncbi:uncharacterized protein LDX57_001148 [Aspergillus melleus]|uniref:uncharacterized protein n=1 Tax=Aspergillus melleus TaxID=138277 RepID=UPI001E8DC450|nr:uncharacterized protein LDX57_001148 [Aspergillus melleus]KAH8423390.1 hypothetical protein LDX57_001148 [Aspergillus melleus]